MLLQTVISRLPLVPNQTNAALLQEMMSYMKRAGSSEHHIKNHVYQNLLFAMHLGASSFFDVSKQSEIIEFLETKRKPANIDPDERWKTTYNDYLDSIKFFFRWLYNQRGRDDLTDSDYWETPTFAKIRHLKSARKSPYADAEKWEKSEILTIIPYCTHPRNKAALGLFWDLDARNHEVTALKLKHIRLNERYAEGEIPHNTKTGGAQYAYATPTIEEPGRAMTQLRNLARGHALSHGRNYVTSEDMPLLVNVALSTAPIERVTLFELLLEHKGQLATSTITASLRVSPPTGKRTMTELYALDLVDMIQDNNQPNSEYKVKLKDEFDWFLGEEFKALREGKPLKEKCPPHGKNGDHQEETAIGDQDSQRGGSFSLGN